MLKIIVLMACVAAVVAVEEDYHDHPQYKYQYGVKDDHTGDNKEQWEHRDGDIVQGSYSVHEPDGTHRVVEYKSDKAAGFQAHVQREGHAQHPPVYGEHVDEHGHGGESYANIDQHH